MTDHEWIHLTKEQLDADEALAPAVDRFVAPVGRAGDAAAMWLRERALGAAGHVATYVLLAEGEIAAFHSLGMSEVELRTQHRKRLAVDHPRLGAVLILWLARGRQADVGAETILRHAVGVAQIAARRVGAAVIALDPYDKATERLWRQRFAFRSSLTRRPDADGRLRARLWRPLFPEG